MEKSVQSVLSAFRNSVSIVLTAQEKYRPVHCRFEKFLPLRPEKNGVPLAAEIIPFEPDTGNAVVGIRL